MKYKVSADSQSVVNSGITDDYKQAICEYLWNGFDAGASELNLDYAVNGLGAVTKIKISDNGKGIDRSTLKATFGAFLNSQKGVLFKELLIYEAGKEKDVLLLKPFVLKLFGQQDILMLKEI